MPNRLKHGRVLLAFLKNHSGRFAERSNGYVPPVQVKYHASVTVDERAVVASWIKAHKLDAIDLLVIGDGVVAMFDAPNGPSRGRAGVRPRDNGHLIDALDDALADLVGQPDCPR